MREAGVFVATGPGGRLEARAPDDIRWGRSRHLIRSLGSLGLLCLRLAPRVPWSRFAFAAMGFNTWNLYVRGVGLAVTPLS